MAMSLERSRANADIEDGMNRAGLLEWPKAASQPGFTCAGLACEVICSCLDSTRLVLAQGH